MNSIVESFLGTGQPVSLLGMMSGEEWDRRMLALPAPSHERDEERAAQRNSGYQRALEINRKAQADLDVRIENFRKLGIAEIAAPTWKITLENPKSRKTRLYFVSSCRQLRDGGSALYQSAVVAESEAQAKRLHRTGHASHPLISSSKEINIAAWAPGVMAS